MGKNIFVFASCGYCEYALLEFLSKINPQVEWSLKLPYRKKKPKKAISNSEIVQSLIDFIIPSEINGLTGESISNYVLAQLERKPYLFEDCDVILLEDDTDTRAENINNPQQFLLHEKQSFSEKISCLIGENVIETYILYAVPEIEAWFIADWNNGFGSLDPYFSNKLARYINDNFPLDIEQYRTSVMGKMSDRIINECINNIARGPEDRDKVYRKKVHGYLMLQSIEPDIVARRCRLFFANTYRELQLIR